MRGDPSGRRLALCAVVALSAAAAAAAESATNASDGRAALRPMKAEAARHEQAGRTLEAARVYERIMQADPTMRTVLPPRLALLYAEAGRAEQALAWAREAMKTNPDPPAYLAGGHARLGQYAEAKGILAEEIRKTGDVRRKIVLHWQLADACAEEGRRQEAERFLRAAADLAAGTVDEQASRRRLRRFRETAAIETKGR